MEEALEILKKHLASLEAWAYCGEEILAEMEKTKEAIAGLEKIQLTRREWYQKGYKDAMNKIVEGNSNET